MQSAGPPRGRPGAELDPETPPGVPAGEGGRRPEAVQQVQDVPGQLDRGLPGERRLLAGPAKHQLAPGGVSARLELRHGGVRQHARHGARPGLLGPVVALHLHGPLLRWKSHRKYSLWTNSGQVCPQYRERGGLMSDQVRAEVRILRDAGDGHQSEHCYRLLSQLHCLHCAQVGPVRRKYILALGINKKQLTELPPPQDHQRPHLPRPLPDPVHPLPGGDGPGLQDRGRHDDLHVLRRGADDPRGPLLLLQLLVRAGHGDLPALHSPILLLVMLIIIN